MVTLTLTVAGTPAHLVTVAVTVDGPGGPTKTFGYRLGSSPRGMLRMALAGGVGSKDPATITISS